MNRLVLYLNSNEYCKTSSGDMINVGDVVRLPCDGELHGVVTKRCLERENGLVWGNETAYCSDMAVAAGRGRVRFGVAVNGIRYDSIDEAEATLVATLEGLLHLGGNQLNVYYLYYRIDSEPFCYLELYMECEASAWRTRRILRSLKTRQCEMAKQIVAVLKKDAFVTFLKDVYYMDDIRLVVVVAIAIGLVIAVAAIWILAVVSSRRRKEKELNDLLMLWSVS